MLLAAGPLFERRIDDQWWGFRPAGSAPTRLLTVDGECQTTDNRTWLVTADGTLLRVEPTAYAAWIRFDGLVSAAATGTTVAALAGDRLWVGPDEWQEWVFPGPFPAAVRAAGGAMWMLSGAQVLRFDGAFQELEHALEEPVLELHPHPGGVWLVGQQAVCHAGVGPMGRVEGLRAGARSLEGLYDVAIRTRLSATTVTARLDDAPLALGWDADAERYTARVELDHAGWHVLRVTADDGAVTTHRDVPIKLLPRTPRSFADDILPIAQRSCAGGATCHGPGAPASRPALATHTDWTSGAEAIRRRVVELETMPPPSSRGPEWQGSEVGVIADWLEGGMSP